MRIILCHTGLAIDIIGIRLLSALLKQAGFNVELLFIPNMEYELKRRGFHNRSFVTKYSEMALEQITDFCRDADLIGLSLISRDLDAAIDVTNALKQNLKTSVIWGGFHPTIFPEESLEFADMVCIGEGERPLLELVELMDAGKDYSNVSGIWIKKNMKRNPVGQLIQNLDAMPFSDYDFSTQYLLTAERIEPLTSDLFLKYMKATFPALRPSNYKRKEPIPGSVAYHIIGKRGCPMNCTFCGSPQLKKIYAGQKYVRRRSVDNIISELKSIKARFDFFSDVNFPDDCFMMMPVQYVKEFCEKYKEEINMPFYCLTNPSSITEDRLEYFVDAGLIHLDVGIQSGSKRITELYNRVNANRGVENAIALINRFEDRLFPYYDFIIDNPLETEKDQRATLELISKMKRPFKIRVYSFVPYPGTVLYDILKEKELLKGDNTEFFRKDFAQRGDEKSYLNLLIDLSKYNLPCGVTRFLRSDLMIWICTKTIIKGASKLVYKLISVIHYFREKSRYKQGKLLE